MDDLSFEAGVEEIDSFYDHIHTSLDHTMQDDASSPPEAERVEGVAASHSSTAGPELDLLTPFANPNHLSTPIDLLHLHQREVLANVETNDRTAQHSAAVDPPASSPPSLAPPLTTNLAASLSNPADIDPACPSPFESGHLPSNDHSETSPDLPGAAEPETTSHPTTQPTQAFYTPNPAPTRTESHTTEMREASSSGAGSKHSLMHEMRAEELRYLPSGDAAVHSHPRRTQQTASPTDTTVEKDDNTIERLHIARNSDSEGDAESSSRVNLSARLRKVAEVKGDSSPAPTVVEAVKHAELNADNPASEGQQAHEEKEDEQMAYGAIKPQGKKRKRSLSPQFPTQQQPAPQTSKTKRKKRQPKKNTKAAPQPTDPIPTRNPEETNQKKPARNSLRRNELQTLLSGWPYIEPPQIVDGEGGNGSAPSQRRTRAQKLLAKEREPNAGMAAKATHRKGSGE